MEISRGVLGGHPARGPREEEAAQFQQCEGRVCVLSLCQGFRVCPDLVGL